MSRCLSDRSIDHVVIERGEIAHSWRFERWDSLRLLTPNWQSRLPGYGYSGDDPDGYRLVFYTPVAMESCQSCGMPLADAEPGQMYCDYCTDEKGTLRPYEQVFEGTVTGYFMGMQKMGRKDAEKAAKEHLGKMPAWVGR